jgi:hypothetical protein
MNYIKLFESFQKTNKIILFELILSGHDFVEFLTISDSFEDIKKEYDTTTPYNIEPEYANIDTILILEKYEYTYEFIYDLDIETESIEDYPIEEYYQDSNYYTFVDKVLIDTIDSKSMYINEESDKILSEVETYFYKKYGKFKYNTIYVYDTIIDEDDGEESEELKNTITLRISNHTENIDNVSLNDYHISVVIANHDATLHRFDFKNQMKRHSKQEEMRFDSTYSTEEIISQIEEKIEEFKEDILS